MVRTAVPEAAVHEDRHLRACEHDVDAPHPKPSEPLIDPIPEPPRMES
jgi:hypothetical protein